jgi:hypothetical protein
MSGTKIYSFGIIQFAHPNNLGLEAVKMTKLVDIQGLLIALLGCKLKGA